jgi:hypothetical protein
MADQMLSQGHLWFLGDLSLLHPKNSDGELKKRGIFNIERTDEY